MKSDERHHLHENDLASALDKSLKRVEPYSNRLVVAVLIAAVVLVGFMVWRRASSASSTKGWGELAVANSPDALLTVADDHPRTDVADWAELRGAELFLAEGLRSAVSDRKTTTERLGNAEKAFQKLLQNNSIPSQVRERALYGLAVCRETLSGEDTQKAIAAYEELLRVFPASQFAGLAANRIADLKKESTREFYAWFDKQPRQPEDRPQPKDLGAAAGAHPDMSADPFPWQSGPATAPATHDDRPPSPTAPVRQGELAKPFPDAAAPAPGAESTTPPEAAPPGAATSTKEPPAETPATKESGATSPTSDAAAPPAAAPEAAAPVAEPPADKK